MTEQERVRAVLARIYQARGDVIHISPAWLATEAMQKLDPDRVSPDLVYLAAHLELKQLARELCRNKTASDETEQHELWPELQKRYPVAKIHGEDPVYVLLEHMTEEDVNYNIARLEAEADAKKRHADALRAWWKDRAA